MLRPLCEECDGEGVIEEYGDEYECDGCEGSGYASEEEDEE